MEKQSGKVIAVTDETKKDPTDVENVGIDKSYPLWTCETDFVALISIRWKVKRK